MPAKNQYCPERPETKDDKGKAVPKEHCWHVWGQPNQQPPNNIIFVNVCCFCAPTWLHFPIFKVASQAQVSDEDMTASEMQHGHLISMHRAQQKPKLALV